MWRINALGLQDNGYSGSQDLWLRSYGGKFNFLQAYIVIHSKLQSGFEDFPDEVEGSLICVLTTLQPFDILRRLDWKHTAPVAAVKRRGLPIRAIPIHRILETIAALPALQHFNLCICYPFDRDSRQWQALCSAVERFFDRIRLRESKLVWIRLCLHIICSERTTGTDIKNSGLGQILTVAMDEMKGVPVDAKIRFWYQALNSETAKEKAVMHSGTFAHTLRVRG